MEDQGEDASSPATSFDLGELFQTTLSSFRLFSFSLNVKCCLMANSFRFQFSPDHVRNTTRLKTVPVLLRGKKLKMALD